MAEHMEVGRLVILETATGQRPGHYLRPLKGSGDWHLVEVVYPNRSVGAPRRFHSDDIAAAAQCRSCGCSEFFACPEGCSWVESDLCSSCAS